MIVLRCGANSLRLANPASCQSQSLTATLTRANYPTVALTVVADAAGVTLTVPGNPARGVWTLNIKTQDCCCCFTAPVFYDSCSPLQVQGEHTQGHSTGAGTATACCD